MSPFQKKNKNPVGSCSCPFSKRYPLGTLFDQHDHSMIAQSISPILPLYVRALGQRDNLIFVSGMIVSAMGVSSMLFSGWMGKLGDRIGNHRLLLIALLYSGCLYILCAQAQSPLQLGILRFLFGIGTGALLPGVSALLNRLTPPEGISRIFSYNQLFYYLGGVLGHDGVEYFHAFWLSLGILRYSPFGFYRFDVPLILI